MAVRFVILTVFFGLLYAFLGFNLYRVQILKRDYYIERAEARSEAIKALSLRRGTIFFTDRSGADIPVALNKDYPVLYADPKEIKNVPLAVGKLNATLGFQIDGLQTALSNKTSRFKLLLGKEATQAQIDAVLGLRIKGIYKGTKQYRYYPWGSLASQLIGFVGVNAAHPEPAGLYGIEKYDNDTLAAGNDVHLTIDRALQAQSEQILSQLVSKFNAAGGTVIVQEPSTGKILTLANKSDFDPNLYKDASVGSFTNPAVQAVYEPGSVFKPLTMAAGIDSGAFTPDTTFNDTGSITLNGKTIRNWDKKAHGKVTMTNVIEQSINTGAIFAEQKMGNKTFYEYLKKFGFGAVSNSDMSDEVTGSIKNLERKGVQAVDFATASYGQGTSVTPVQLITAFSTLANSGLLMRPFVHQGDAPYVVRRVISGDTAGKVTTMLESAVQKAGVASIPLYRVAGKTGTAFIPEKGGYSDQLIHTYIGFAPASNAKFIILLKLEKPQNADLAGMTVVPAFRELAQFVLSYYGFSPDKVAVSGTKN